MAKFGKGYQPSGDAKKEGWRKRKEELAKLQVLSVQEIAKEGLYKEMQTKDGRSVPFIDLLITKLMKEALGVGNPSHKAIELLLKMYQGNFDALEQLAAANGGNIHITVNTGAKIDEYKSEPDED